MQKAEKIIVIFIGLGLLLKVLHVIGAGPIFLMSMGALSMLYFLSAISNNSRFLGSSSSKFKDWLSKSPLVPNLIFGYAFAIGVIGILYTVLLYPGNESMINVSLIGVAVALIYSVIKYKGEFVEKMKPFFVRIISISAFVLFFFLLPKESIIDFYYSDYPDYANVMKELQKDPHNIALLDSARAERLKMEILMGEPSE